MTKFPSIWGDITVSDESKIIKPDATKENKKPDKIEKPDGGGDDGGDEENARGDGGTPPETPASSEDAAASTDANEGGDETVNPGEETKDEGDGDYEYTEEDVSKAYGILEEEGVLELTEDDEFENTPSGLADAIAATVRNKLANEIAAIPPVVQDVYAHIMAGNNISSFTASSKQVKWKDYNIEEEANQKVALKSFYLKQGMTDEEATDEVAEMELAGKLEKKSSVALNSLTKLEESQITASAAKDKKDAEDAKKAATKEVTDIKNKIDSLESLADFKLDDSRKQNFKDYLFKVNARTGKTQMQENMASDDRRMTIAFLDFVNYTKADLTKEVQKTLTKTRKKKLSRYADSSVKNVNSSTVKTKLDAKKGTLKFPTIFGTQSIEVED